MRTTDGTMRRIFIINLILILLVACSIKKPAPAELPATAAPQVISTPSSTAQDKFQAKAWVANPTPPLNSRLVVRGSLIRNGRLLSGIMMLATWPDETHEGGVASCTVLVNYGSGVCMIDVSRFPPDKFVPINVTINYRGRDFGAQTGFTPHQP
jgi:hypothetical protein